MEAKYVYGAVNQIYVGTLKNMADLAIRACYKFFLFNDIIYYITEQGEVSKTGLIKSDIFQYL
jgi:hypothetical protein